MYALIKNEEVTKMHEIINKIVQQNQSLFGTNPKIDKINIGFTNTIYNINDLYIVKICTDEDNEKEPTPPLFSWVKQAIDLSLLYGAFVFTAYWIFIKLQKNRIIPRMNLNRTLLIFIKIVILIRFLKVLNQLIWR